MIDKNEKKINRAVLVGLNAHCLTKAENASESSMEELAALLETAGGETMGVVTQSKDTPDPRTFIGEGKVQEVSFTGVDDALFHLADIKFREDYILDSFVQKGINAGKIVGEIARATGANGGGRPNFAQGGVKDASLLDEILAKVEAGIKG